MLKKRKIQEKHSATILSFGGWHHADKVGQDTPIRHCPCVVALRQHEPHALFSSACSSRAAAAAAIALSRIVILPTFLCSWVSFGDDSWQCKWAGALDQTLPFHCPIDTIMKPHVLCAQLSAAAAATVALTRFSSCLHSCASVKEFGDGHWR